MEGPNDVRSSAFFIPRLELFKTVEPYYLNKPSSVLPQSNANTVRVNNILFQDLRGRENEKTFKERGFGVIDFHYSLKYDDFFNHSMVHSVYAREIATCLAQYTGGNYVHIFDLNVRGTVMSLYA
jgi:hypothetical protein